MPLTVRLDARTEGLVNRLARRTGRTKSAIVRDAIRRLARPEDGSPASLHDAMRHLVGAAPPGPADLSRRTGDRFRALLAKRRRR